MEPAEEASGNKNHAYLGVCCSALLCVLRGHWGWARAKEEDRCLP